ncbi:MAG TPA: hypothetical protein VHU42_17015 [Rhodopila sp.]|nr:hypothetical protein [Rhodopila sp.]
MSSTTLDPTQTGHRHPADLFMTLIVALLAPMFLTACGGDITLARMAAAETVNAHRIETLADMLAVAQIIAFGFAALGSLCQSVGDDLSLSMVLRLRGNAVALNRAAERCRRTLPAPAEEGATSRNLPTIRQPESEPAPPLAPLAAPLLAPLLAPLAEPGREPGAGLLTPEQFDQMMAAESEARLRYGFEHAANHGPTPPTPKTARPSDADEQRFRATLAAGMRQNSHPQPAGAHLPPTDRKPASFRTAALSTTAHQPLTGNPLTGNPPTGNPPTAIQF